LLPMSLEITRHLPVSTLVTGHFNNRSGYYAYRPGGTDDFLLIYTLAGTGQYTDRGGAVQHAQPGDVTLHWPGAYQHYGVDERQPHWELLWTHFRPRTDWLDLVHWPDLLPGVGRLRLAGNSRQGAILETFWRIHQFASGVDPLRDRL